jgi:hypothetical protein
LAKASGRKAGSALGLALAGSLFLAATVVEAQGFQTDEGPTVQIAPFAGYHFGGSIWSETLERQYSFKSGLDYGGTLDIALSETWRLEFLYLRQETSLESSGIAGPSFDITLERYMIGIQEEKGEGSVKVFGVLLAGATRLVPGFEDAGSETYFSAGLSLGVKTFFTRNAGLRFEARGFYTRVSGGGGVFCTAGQCLFSFSGSGVWQGDVSGGLIIAF